MMTTTAGAAQSQITLKGSTDVVTEFFGYAINSILYQRGIYPPESFKQEKKYGLSLLMTSEPGLVKYINSILDHLKSWLTNHNVQKLVLVVCEADSGATLERWQFDLECDRSVTDMNAAVPSKSEQEIQKEIQNLLRQIVASVSFLPLLDVPCTFDLLVYADKDMATPETWEESDPRYIENPAEVHLRSFTTKIHKVETTVTYKRSDF